jgi:hypothetical protein
VEFDEGIVGRISVNYGGDLGKHGGMQENHNGDGNDRFGKHTADFCISGENKNPKISSKI